MRIFKVFITLNVPQKCSVKYYTNAEMLKISKKIVQSVEYSPRPYNNFLEEISQRDFFFFYTIFVQ